MLESLIAMALSLIMAAQTPNIPVELRTKSLLVAQNVLIYASTVQTEPVKTVQIIQPVFTSQAPQNTEKTDKPITIVDKSKIVIFGGRGDWQKEYKVKDDAYLCYFCVDSDGRVRSELDGTFITSDPAQDKVQHGTGSLQSSPVIYDGKYYTGYYYSIDYDFKTTGTHSITFKCNGIEKTTTFLVR